MSYLRYIFPLAAAALVLWTARRWLPLFAQPLPAPGEPPAPKPRLSFAAAQGGLVRLDLLCLAAITAVYGVVAFLGLGDRQAPESFCHFTARGQYALVELPAETELGALRYYSGLNTGEYRVEFSLDGESFWDAGALDQKYSLLFKWNDMTFDESAARTARYIRVTAGADLYLGELALYGADGALLDSAGFAYDAGCAALFDEQALVPEAASYRNSSYFDEIYHARTAYEHLENVYPYEITHPPLGKLIIGLGIRLFGMNPFGWRFMGTLFGVLMLPILYVFLKRMFASTAIAACGTVIFAFDFMHFVQTRIATIDTYSVFFILLMYLFMWRYISGGRLRDLALSGLFFGLGAASKWTCIYAGGGLAVIWLWHWITRRRENEFWSKFLTNCLFCLVFFVALPCAVYYASYYCYGTARGLEGGLSMLFSGEYAEIVWNNQVYMWEYHSDLVAEHPYASSWYQWLVDARPILYYLEYFDDGTKSAFGAFMDPLFCWSGLFAVIGCGILAVKDRDGRALFIVLGYLAQFLPWVLVSRLTFAYHYFPSSLFLLLALCHMFSRLREEAARAPAAVSGTGGAALAPGRGRRRAPAWQRSLVALTGASVALFALFYPVLTGLRVPVWYTSFFCKWFPSWPF